MIDRYTRPEMGAIWTDENRYKAWLEVEILADEAWAELGVMMLSLLLVPFQKRLVKSENGYTMG